ncbi:MAG: 30S ribosomal protein S13 [Candidatus Aenigmarchaeota archaeon]|nr:30S ribosomal protein S13 [Candidatus Aenigmarchaeota archaeon]
MGSRKPKAKEGKDQKEEKPKKEEKKKPDVRHNIPLQIIRVVGTDLDGGKPVYRALMKIKGISFHMSNAICLVSKIDPRAKLGALSESDIKVLEDVIRSPIKFGIPSFMVNRQRDPATGDNVHLTSSDLDISKRFDVQKYIDLRTYRGWRHMFGQPVRGQRTRSTFRTGTSVGVVKKSVKPQAAGAVAAPAPAAKAPEKK